MTQVGRYITVQQAAEELGFTVGQILYAIDSDKLSAVKTKFAILPEDLEAFRTEYVRVKSNGESYVRMKPKKDKQAPAKAGHK